MTMLEIQENGFADFSSTEPRHSQYFPLYEEVKNGEQPSFDSLCQYLAFEPTLEYPCNNDDKSIVTHCRQLTNEEFLIITSFSISPYTERRTLSWSCTINLSITEISSLHQHYSVPTSSRLSGRGLRYNTRDGAYIYKNFKDHSRYKNK